MHHISALEALPGQIEQLAKELERLHVTDEQLRLISALRASALALTLNMNTSHVLWRPKPRREAIRETGAVPERIDLLVSEYNAAEQNILSEKI
jgi:hypothetical protein